MKLLDTDVCIAFLNGKDKQLEHRMLEAADELVLSSIVKAELWFGAEASKRVTQNYERLATFFDTFDCLPFDDAAARRYARVRAALKRIGQPISPNDLLIASTALANDAALVTRNRKEFDRVPGLIVEAW